MLHIIATVQLLKTVQFLGSPCSHTYLLIYWCTLQTWPSAHTTATCTNM